MSEVLIVFGATGNQGGSVIKHVLDRPSLFKKFKIRAITRDPTKSASTNLAAMGSEVVSVNAPVSAQMMRY
jgi:uncharacterized protein YbjT (DUF2867 family)